MSDCYYEECPICKKDTDDGKLCRSCIKNLMTNKLVDEKCNRCLKNSTFVLCVDCHEDPAFYCVDCYDTEKSYGDLLYTKCCGCL